MYCQTLSLLCGHRIQWTMHRRVSRTIHFCFRRQRCSTLSTAAVDVVWWGVVIKEMINNGSCEFYNTAMVIIIINLLETELTAPRWNNITISLLLYNNHSVLCWRPVSHAKSQKGWLGACKGWKGRNEREISLGNSMIDWKVYGPLNPPHAPAILKLYSFGHQSSL